MVLSDYGFVCGNHNNVHSVYVSELAFLCLGGTCHTGAFCVFIEEVLERDCCQCNAFSFDLNVFLCLDCLVKTVGVTSAGHDTAGELVYDKDFVVGNNVVLVAEHVVVRFKSVIYMMLDLKVFSIGIVIQIKEFLRFFYTFLGQCNGFRLFVYNEVAFFYELFLKQRVKSLFLVEDGAFFQTFYEKVGDFIKVSGFCAAAGDDERGPRFIDKNGVHLVDNCVMKVSLHQSFPADHHIVSQVVESKLVIRCVCDVAVIGFSSLVRGHIVQDNAY